MWFVAWLLWLLAAIGATAVLGLPGVWLLRWQVQAQTVLLSAKNAELERALQQRSRAREEALERERLRLTDPLSSPVTGD